MLSQRSSMDCLFYFTLRTNSCPQSQRSATSHLIKYQIWIWLFLCLHFCAQSRHSEAEQKLAHFESLQHRPHQTTGRSGANFRVRVRTTFLRKQHRLCCFSKAGGYISHRSGGHILFKEEKEQIKEKHEISC